MATKSRPGAANLVRGRFARRGALGAGGSNPLTAIAPWRIGTTRWRNARWGAKDWLENAINYSQVVDIDIPEGTPPPGGWPCLGRAHAAQGVHTVPDGSSIDTMVRSVALANGIAFITFAGQHPYLSATPEVMPDDVPVFWAWFQQLAPYLGIDPHGISFFTQSRGSMVLEAALRNPLVDPELMWCINPQFSYRPLVGYNTLLATPADIAAALAAEPDDPRQNSAFLEVATAARVPKLVALHEGAYWQRKISFAEYGVWSTHTPDQGLYFRDEYKKRGMQDRIVVADQVSGNANTMADIVPTLLMVRQGVPLPEAVALARAYRRGHAVHYLKDLTGVTKQQDGSGGTPAQGDVIGRIVDGRFGIANRSAVNPLGNPAGNIGTVRPRLQGLPNGGWAARFDADDKLICPMTIPNTASYGFAWWDSTSFNSVPSQVSGTQIAWGYPNTDQVLAVVADAPLLPSELRIYAQLAGQLAGVDLLPKVLPAVDAVTKAGAVILTDAAQAYETTGRVYARSGAILLPQNDGRLASTPSNALGRYWDGVRWLHRFDPPWRQHFKNSHDLETASWVRLGGDTVGVNVVAGPDLSLTADEVRNSTATNSGHGIGQGGVAYVAGKTYCVEAYVQDIPGQAKRYVSLVLPAAIMGTFRYGIIDPANGSTYLVDPSISFTWRQLADGWRLITATFTPTASATTQVELRTPASTADPYANIAGDGLAGMRFGGVNLSESPYPTPLVRSDAGVVDIGSPSWTVSAAAVGVNLAQGYTLITEAYADYRFANQYPALIAARNSAANNSTNSAEIFVVPGGGLFALVRINSVDQYGVSIPGNPKKIALRVEANNFRCAYDGVLGALDTSGALPDANMIQIGSNGASHHLAGGSGRNAVLGRAATDAELIAFTT